MDALVIDEAIFEAPQIAEESYKRAVEAEPIETDFSHQRMCSHWRS